MRSGTTWQECALASDTSLVTTVSKIPTTWGTMAQTIPRGDMHNFLCGATWISYALLQLSGEVIGTTVPTITANHTCSWQ